MAPKNAFLEKDLYWAATLHCCHSPPFNTFVQENILSFYYCNINSA